eukprot:COSAG02_NODE_4825_length_4935_cov_19.885029_4_plen_764_part_00
MEMVAGAVVNQVVDRAVGQVLPDGRAAPAAGFESAPGHAAVQGPPRTQADGYIDHFIPGPLRYILDQLGQWTDAFIKLLFVLLVLVVLLVAVLTVQTLFGGCPACADDGGAAPGSASTLLLGHIAFPVISTLVSVVAWVGFNSLLGDGLPGWFQAYMTRNRDAYLHRGQLPASHTLAARLCEHAEAAHQQLVAAGVPRKHRFHLGCAVSAIFVAVLPMWMTAVLLFAVASAHAAFTALVKLMHPHCVSVTAVRPARSNGKWQYQVSLSHLAPDVQAGTPQTRREVLRRFRDFRFLHKELAPIATRYDIHHVKTLPTAEWLTDSGMNSPTSVAKDVGKGMFAALAGLVGGVGSGGAGAAGGTERMSRTLTGSEQERKALERARRLEVWLRAVLVDYRLNGQHSVEQIFLDLRIGAGGCKEAHEQLSERSLDPTDDSVFGVLGRQLKDLEEAVQRADKAEVNRAIETDRAAFAAGLRLLADTIDGGYPAGRDHGTIPLEPEPERSELLGSMQHHSDTHRAKLLTSQANTLMAIPIHDDYMPPPEVKSNPQPTTTAEEDIPPALPSVPAPRDVPPEFRTTSSGTDCSDHASQSSRVDAPATLSVPCISERPAILLSKTKLEWPVSGSSSLPRTSSGQQFQHVTLRNPSNERSLFFKVKLTNRARYAVVPHIGLVAASATLELKVVLLPLPASLDLHSGDPKALTDTFLIQAAWEPLIEVGQPTLTAELFWEKYRDHHKTHEGKVTLGNTKFSSRLRLPRALDAVDE